MEEYWFLAPMSRLAISSASLNFFSETFHYNLPVARTKQQSRSMKKNYFVSEGDRVTRLDLIADWAEKYFSAQSAGPNSITSGTGSVRKSSQGLFSS